MIEPLRRKLTVEREYLVSMEKALQIIAQKSELLEKHQELLREEAWGQVVVVEREQQELARKLSKKQQEQQERQRQIDTHQEQKFAQENALEKLGKQRDRLYQKLEKANNRLRTIDGLNQSNRRMMSKNRKKLEEQQQRYDQLLASKGSDQQRQELQKQLQRISQEKQRLERIKDTVGEDFFGEAHHYERYLLAEALSYYQALAQDKLTVYGPIFQELKKRHDEQRDSLAALAGAHLFSFVAGDKDQFKKAISLAQKCWPQQQPPFFIVLSEPSKDYKAGKLVSGLPRPLQYFFEQRLQVAATPSGQAPLTLLGKAQKLGKTISVAGRIYHPWPAMGGSWTPEILASCFLLSLDELEDALAVVRTHEQLLAQEQQIHEQLKAMEVESQLANLKERIDELQQDNDNLQQEIDSNETEAEQLGDEIASDNSAYNQVLVEMEKGSEERQKLKENLFAMEKDQANLEQFLAVLEQEKDAVAEKLEPLLTKARDSGERPKAIRAVNVVSEERIHLEGKLATLQVTQISEEEFQAQQEKVRRLEEEMGGSDQHLDNLKTDMQERFDRWHQEVGDKIRGISTSMNRLLTAVAQGVRLQIDNLKSPHLAGLCLEVQRQGQKWHDLAHLSGGEKVLTVEALILSLHLQTDSPLHAIDECTQRLDLQFKSQSFDMVRQAVKEIGQESQGPFAPQFILLAPDTLGVNFSAEAESYFKRIVLSAAQLQLQQQRRGSGQ